MKFNSPEFNVFNENIYIDKKTIIEEGVTIYPFNIIVGNSVIKQGVVLYPGNYIVDSSICEGASITYSVVENSVVKNGAKIGPFSHLRPGSEIGEEAKIGNFVEIKNSKIGKNTKASHLSYIGDGQVGDRVNIGCGVVFVNFTGKCKEKTTIGSDSFVGSSVNLIAPVSIGEKAFIAAGTTVDKNINNGDFVIGRSKMQTKEGKAKKYLKEV